MDDSFQELKFVLQTLGLPVSGQLHLVEDDCTRIAILTGAFAAAQRAVRLEASEALTPEQTSALRELGARLAEVQQQTRAPLCSELAMRQSADWQQVRTMARKALVQFQWTLELPPHEAIHIQSYLN
ncbi:MAG: hypothetical protein RRC07_12635 [Anaerolineae bacterium]|nr:hypothetical protein [Anaerolineae bacterium]